MKNTIQAIHHAGLTLADFRHKTKSERSLLWLLVVANVELSTFDIIETCDDI